MAFRVGGKFVLAVAVALAAMGQTVDEYQLKAAFLFNLAKFVEWPAESFKDPKDPIVICILGRSPITEALDLAVRDKTANGRSFVIRLVPTVRQASNCQVLFVSSSGRNGARSTVPDMNLIGVLSVGETDTFFSEGGIVNFKLEDGRVRIQINVDAATQRRIQISSKLLNLAQIVKR